MSDEAGQVNEAERPDAVVLAAPHGSRLLAFSIDLAVVIAVAFALGSGWPRTLGVFVAYHTALVWMTGQTIGKAVANLEIRRVDGTAFVRTRSGLLWALGRASVGYLLVDALGLGVLVALTRRNRAHRCVHDWVFASQVALRGETDWAIPRLRQRLSDFAARREEASEELASAQKEGRRATAMWHWLVTGALALEKLLHLLQGIVTHVSAWFGGGTPTHAGASAISAKAVVGVAAASSALTVGAVTAVVVLPDTSSDPVVGQWEVLVIEKTAAHSYVGTAVEDVVATGTACVWNAGTEIMRLSGEAPAYTGEVQWAYGSTDACDRFEWRDATFTLHDSGTSGDASDDTLTYCPTPPSGVEDCAEFRRG